LPEAGWGSGSGSDCCALVAGSAICTAGSSVLRPMVRAGGALGWLLPCDELPWPLLPAAAAALVEGPPPAPLLPAVALPLPFLR
jgi:hypothetical protein